MADRSLRDVVIAAWLATVSLLLAACSGDPGSGPVEVKWDRDVCQRCNMVLSDRRHAAQVRYTPGEGQRSQVQVFDDLGCAVLWLDRQAWRNDPAVEIWVTDRQTGKLLDARTAYYLPGQLTPMQYGLGAQTEHIAGTLDFAAAREHIYAIEERFNVHGGNLEQHATSALPPIQGADADAPSTSGESR